MEKATFAAGCFWGVQHRFDQLEGVVSTSAGYMGGQLPQPTYQQVCTDRTGHAEVVQVHFDPARISYLSVVEKFFDIHDPTTLNRQGEDWGSQYRSAIFHHSPDQHAIAESVRDRLNRDRFEGRIVTQIAAAGTFWPAEEYHQKYADKHPVVACAF